MERAKLDGVELEYEIRGSGEPVLLIHGSHVAGAFLPVLNEPALADRYQLIRYHRRGLAGSTHTAPPVGIEAQAADAAGLLDHVGVRRAHVVGQSYGGVIALQLALDRPETIESLALLEPPLMMVPSAEAFFASLQPALESYGGGDREAAVAAFLSVVSGLDWKTCRDLIEERVPGGVAQAIEDADTFYRIELPALNDWAFKLELAHLVIQPVLLVLGSESIQLFVDGWNLLHSWLQQVDDCTVEGAGHLLQMQHPEPVARGIAEFFGRHPFTAG
jgi:pimeloyl-ACP methyl ester carboxylesterase